MVIFIKYVDKEKPHCKRVKGNFQNNHSFRITITFKNNHLGVFFENGVQKIVNLS